MSHRLRLLVLIGILCTPVTVARGQEATTGTATANDIGRLLEETGLPYRRVQSAGWSVAFEGAKNPSVHVLILPSKTGERVFVLSVIIKHEEIDEHPAALRALLSLNNSIDAQLSVLRDDDDDYIVSSFYALKSLDADSFKAAIARVAVTSDTAYGAVKSAISENESFESPVKGLRLK